MKGLDWCMVKAGVRYIRIPDPAHVLSARGGQGGRNENADNHRKRIPNKNVYSRNINFFSRAYTVGPSVKKLNKRFVLSFIHSFKKDCCTVYTWTLLHT